LRLYLASSPQNNLKIGVVRSRTACRYDPYCSRSPAITTKKEQKLIIST